MTEPTPPRCRRCEGVTEVPVTTVYLCATHQAQDDALLAKYGHALVKRAALNKEDQ